MRQWEQETLNRQVGLPVNLLTQTTGSYKNSRGEVQVGGATTPMAIASLSWAVVFNPASRLMGFSCCSILLRVYNIVADFSRVSTIAKLLAPIFSRHESALALT